MKVSYHKRASRVLYYLCCFAALCALAATAIATVATVSLLVVKP